MIDNCKLLTSSMNYATVVISILLLLMSGCTKSSSTSSALNTNTQEYLAVISHSPLSNEVVFSDSSVSVTFSHDIDMSTVDSSSFYVLDERNLVVQGTYNYIPAAKTLRFIPQEGFEWGCKYTVYITTGIYNTKGLHMKQGYSFSFSIALFYDIQKPRIDTSSIQPLDTVGQDAVISFKIIDNGHIDIASIPAGVIIKNSNGQDITYTYTYIAENKEIRCMPTQPLVEGRTYTVYVIDALHDEAGNSLENPYSWQFTVEATPPQVLSVYPADGQVNVSIGQHISVVFSEPIQEATLQHGFKVVDSYGRSVEGTLLYDSQNYTATFIPNNLEFYTEYTVTITADIKDISGISLPYSFMSSFTTMQENILPQVVSVTPASPIDVNTVFQIAFSEQMDTASLYESIMLYDSYGNRFAVRIEYDEQINVCTVTPEEPLTGFYDYILEISTGATDIHGNPLAQQYVYTYTTNPAPIRIAAVVYMPLDYSGGEYIIDDVNELIAASSAINPSVMRVICLVDYQYNNNTRLFESIYGFRRDISLNIAGFTGNELNTAHKDTLSQLLNFIHSNYRPQQILFMLVDRKTKPLWCIAEDVTSGSYLSVHDFALAMKNNNIGVIAIDAPVKSTVEVAYELRTGKTQVRYLVASQGEVLWGGFHYTALLNNVYATILQPPPDNTLRTIAESICNTTAYPLPAEQKDTRSLALIDLQQIEMATVQMNSIVDTCNYLYGTNPQTIDMARFAAYFYYPIPWYVDLVEFLQATGNTQLQNAATSFFNSVIKKVMPVANTHSGLSILFSTKTHERWYGGTNPYSIEFVNDFGWDEFLQNKHFGTRVDPNEPDNDDESAYVTMSIKSTDSSKQISLFNYIHDINDNDIYTVKINYSSYVYEFSSTGTKVINSEDKNLKAIVSSDDGMTIAVVAENGFVSLSRNGGLTWIPCSSLGQKNWSAVAMSENGSTIAACVEGGYIYISKDYGQSWNESVGAGSRNWRAITCSRDGTKMAAAAHDNFIYISIDGGATWVSKAFKANWVSIAGSENWEKIIAAVYGGFVYQSRNNGESWEAITYLGQKNWKDVECSNKANILAAVAEGGNIWVYTTSWKEKKIPGITSWKSISISDIGDKMAAIAGERIYISTDYGENWSLLYTHSSAMWNDIWYTGNGSKIVAATSLSWPVSIEGTLQINITDVPENCEVTLAIFDQNKNTLLEPGSVTSGSNGYIEYIFNINTNMYMQYYLYVIPINYMKWSMNTRQKYLLNLNYNKNN